VSAQKEVLVLRFLAHHGGFAVKNLNGMLLIPY